MSVLLRRAPLALQSARASLSSASHVRARCPALPSYHRSWAVTHRIRTFASQPPEPPKDEKESSKAEANEKAASGKNAPEPPKDVKGFANSPEPSNSPKKSKDVANKDLSATFNKPETIKLTPEEVKVFDEFVARFGKHLPGAMMQGMETTLAHIKKNGASQDTIDVLKEILEEIRGTDTKLTVVKAARFTKLAMKLVSVTEEDPTLKQALSGRSREDSSEQASGKEESAQQGKESRQEESKKEGKSDPNQQGMRFTEVRFDTGTMITAALTAYLLYRVVVPSENTREITWQEFRTSFLDKGLVEKLVVINSNRVKVFVHRDAVRSTHPDSQAVNPNFFYVFTIGSVEAFERKLDEAQAELDIPPSERIPVSYTSEISWSSTFATVLPMFLAVGALVWLMRRAGGGGGGGGPNSIFGMGRSRAKRFNHETDIQIRFKDVAGMDEAKTEIMEFVSFLKEPGQFQRLGAKIPRGAILSGPPGTGKTLLAKATAGESQVPFFSVSGSEFVEMFVGVGPSRVRDLFANARKNTPCIIFIDEIDAIGKARGKQNFGGGNDERESTLNQILTEMDGFNTSEQVVVLAGTNRPDVLDSALLRPGRFDRHISIDRPTMDGRKAIFAVHLQKILTDENMEHLTGRLAALTPGFSGADIANCCNEAALIAARGKADKVRMTHFEQAIERTVGGLERKSLVLSKEEKRTVAYHEAGHAICGWFFKHADPLLKVSIIPRGQGALGYAQYLPAGDQYLINTSQLLDRMAMTLGGRVSEELHFDTVTSGASDDFKKVTRMATAMVTKWGMSSRIGTLYFEDEGQETLHRPFSEDTAKAIDAEVRRLVDDAYKQCRELLTARKAEVKKVAEALLSQEVLTRDDMVRLLGKRPFEDNKDFEKYFGGGPMAPAPAGAGKSAPPPPPTEGVAL